MSCGLLAASQHNPVTFHPRCSTPCRPRGLAEYKTRNALAHCPCCCWGLYWQHLQMLLKEAPDQPVHDGLRLWKDGLHDGPLPVHICQCPPGHGMAAVSGPCSAFKSAWRPSFSTSVLSLWSHAWNAASAGSTCWPVRMPRHESACSLMCVGCMPTQGVQGSSRTSPSSAHRLHQCRQRPSRKLQQEGLRLQRGCS